jgi:hypothetical protein
VGAMGTGENANGASRGQRTQRREAKNGHEKTVTSANQGCRRTEKKPRSPAIGARVGDRGPHLPATPHALITFRVRTFAFELLGRI